MYIPIHAALLPFLLFFVYSFMGVNPSGPHQMLVYYTVGFVIVLAMMFRFLRASFSDFIGEFWRAVQAIILGYVFYRTLSWAVALLLESFITENDPNSEAILGDIATNFKVMLVVTSVLAPIVEESIFRGALFGTIHKKNRFAAYIVSVVVFGLFHLWDSMLFDFNWGLILHLVLYFPPGIALAWCYERSGTIWAPILLHSIMNLFISYSVK